MQERELPLSITEKIANDGNIIGVAQVSDGRKIVDHRRIASNVANGGKWKIICTESIKHMAEVSSSGAHLLGVPL